MTNIYLEDSLQGLWRRENAGRLINSTVSLQKQEMHYLPG